MLNPSTLYCDSLGYEYETVETPEGAVGMCVFPDNTSANAWDFLIGREALNWSYCVKEGYEAKHIENIEICKISDECTICVLPNATEIEVTELMGLSFTEGRCGDEACQIGENYENCPEDCPSGSLDGYCDGMEDGICDIDCKPEEDSDCAKPENNLLIYLILFVILLIVLIIFFIIKKQPKTSWNKLYKKWTMSIGKAFI